MIPDTEQLQVTITIEAKEELSVSATDRIAAVQVVTIKRAMTQAELNRFIQRQNPKNVLARKAAREAAKIVETPLMVDGIVQP